MRALGIAVLVAVGTGAGEIVDRLSHGLRAPRRTGEPHATVRNQQKDHR